MPLLLVTGLRALEDPEFLERRSTSRFPGVPDPVARFAYHIMSITASYRTNDVGQNVNKVNTKATVRCALDSTWIPSWAHGSLQESVCWGVCLA
jgi:hypothetical protein